MSLHGASSVVRPEPCSRSSYHCLLQRGNAFPPQHAGHICTGRLSVHVSHTPTSPMCSAAAPLFIGGTSRTRGEAARYIIHTYIYIRFARFVCSRSTDDSAQWQEIRGEEEAGRGMGVCICSFSAVDNAETVTMRFGQIT